VYPDPIPDIAMEYFHGYVGEFAVESTSKYCGFAMPTAFSCDPIADAR